MASSTDIPAPPTVEIPTDRIVSAPAVKSEGNKRTFYIPCLDGIRAVAVTMVFFAHAGVTWVPGGLGVTIFFFLSGYLITTLLRREFERSSQISLKNFYLRRALRIWPPMYLSIAALALVFTIGPHPIILEKRPLLFQLANLSNYYQIYGHGHFIPGSGVLWSLAVEEHFYLVFPLLLLTLFTLGMSRKNVARVLLGVCAAVLMWRCWLIFGWHATELRTYKSSDCRIDSIMYGCILGIFCNPYVDFAKQRLAKPPVALFSAGVLVLLLTLMPAPEWFRESFRYTLQGLALLPIFFMVVAYSQWWIFSWLNLVPLRAIGTISYTIYLIHYSALYLAKDWFPQASHREYTGTQTVLAALMALLFAGLMYLLVERPCALARKRLHKH